MLRVDELLDETNVRCKADAGSRKRVLQVIAALMSNAEIGEDALFDALMARERLGSTGLGDGVAIPHCRLSCAQMRAAFISLPEGIDYEASDGAPVDLLFVLVVPEDEHEAHLQALAALAEVFADPGNRDAFRACAQDDELRMCMSEQLSQFAPNSKSA